jgi:nitronate monooxygenase
METSPLPSALPIIQAPMAGGPSTPELTAAVGRTGGFGFLAAGYRSPDQLRMSIAATRRLTDAPFGVNLFYPTPPADPGPVHTYADVIRPESERLGVPLGAPRWDDDAIGDKLDVVASERVAMVSFTFGCPTAAEVETLHTAGCVVAVTVTSAAEARVAEDAGADLVAVQGTEAGGHQGSFLDHEPNRVPLATLLDEVGATTGLPMVGSGGIMTGTRVAEVLGAGAVAAQLGTAFLGCPEAGTSAVHREALTSEAYPGTMLTRAFSGRWGRGLANEFAVAYSNAAPDAYPEVHHLTRPLRAAATDAGDPRVPNLWAGEGWRHVRSEPADVVVRGIASELASALDGRS